MEDSMNRAMRRTEFGLAVLVIGMMLTACSSPATDDYTTAIALANWIRPQSEEGTDDPYAHLREPDRPEANPSWVGLDVFYSDFEYDELEIDGINTLGEKIGTVKINDAEVRRIGGRITFGKDIRGYVQGFGERFFEDDSFDAYGFGFGLKGFPVLARLGKHVGLILPFDAVGNVVGGTGEATIYDSGTGQPVGQVDQLIGYVQGQGHVGLGLDIIGIKGSAGLAINGVYGAFRIDDEVLGPVTIDARGNFDALNWGAYLGLAFRRPNLPIFAEARYHFGNINGFFLAGGLAF
jgi:hypothetical protein